MLKAIKKDGAKFVYCIDLEKPGCVKQRLRAGQNEKCSCSKLDKINEKSKEKVKIKKEKKSEKSKAKCIVANSSSALAMKTCVCRQKAVTEPKAEKAQAKPDNSCYEERLTDLEKIVKNMETTITAMQKCLLDVADNKQKLTVLQGNLKEIFTEIIGLKKQKSNTQLSLRVSLTEQLTDIQNLCACADQSEYDAKATTTNNQNRRNAISEGQENAPRRVESGQTAVAFNKTIETVESKVFIKTEELSIAVTPKSSVCIYCANAATPKTGKSVAAKIRKLVKDHNKNDILLTVVTDQPYYHINVFAIKTGTCLGCVMATQEGFNHTNTQTLLAECVTFFVTKHSCDYAIENVKNISAFFELIRGVERKRRHHKHRNND